MRALLLVLVLGTVASADLTRPAYLGFTETREGRFDVSWRVPRRGDRVLALRVVLPDSFRAVTEPVVRIDAGVQTMTWTIEAKPWEMAGAAIALEGPGAVRVDTMVRFEFRDGTVIARILPPGTMKTTFPERASARSPAREIQDAALAGARHLGTSLACLAFVVGLGLAGSARGAALALALFLLGQWLGILLDLRLPEPLVFALLAVAGAVAASRAGQPESRGLAAMALLCGLAHGAVLPGGYFGAIGADAIALAIALAVTFLPGKRAVAYGVGTAAIAIAWVDATAADASAAPAPKRSVLLAPTAAAAETPASAPVAAASDAPLQVFLEVTPFETRVEWVAKVAALGLGDGSDIAVPEQERLRDSVRDLFERRLAVAIDGAETRPADVRVDLVTREAGGVLERIEPVEERYDEALVGFAASYPTRAPPSEVRVRWRPLAGLASVPAVIVDPANIRSTVLETELVWQDELAMPPVRAVAVRARTIDLSLVSIGLLLFGIVAAVRRWGRGGATAARLLLAGACIAAPYVPITLPLPAAAAPGEREAGEVIEALLGNLYRGLEQQDENAAYDRLRVSVTSDAIQPIFLEQRRLLELGRRGGARARVDSVEVADVQSIEPLDGGGWKATVAWEAGGFVVHYGHRHFRQNRYEAEVELVPEKGSWKFTRLAVADKERLR